MRTIHAYYQHRDTKKMLNSLATAIIDIFRERGMDEAYLETKSKRLKDMGTGDVLFWATHELDSVSKIELAKRLGVTVGQLDAAGVVLVKAYNY